MIPSTERVTHPISGFEYPQALCGAIAPLFTPERLDGRIDYEGLEAQADWLCDKASVSAVIVRSGPGRMWRFSEQETREAIRLVLEVARDRKPVIANTIGIWDSEAGDPVRPAVFRKQSAELSEWAAAEGAAAVLIPVPAPLLLENEYPPQDVALRFFEDLTAAVRVPVIVYNQSDLPPGRALAVETLERLAHRERIVGAICNTTDAAFFGELSRRVPPHFFLGAGNDAAAAAAFISGASSACGPLTALFPEIVHAGWTALREGDGNGLWQAQRDLLGAAQTLSPWTIWDIGCAILHHAGVPMSPRSRSGGRAPLPEEVDAVLRELMRVLRRY